MTEWEQCLADAGCRITASRRAVMQVLLAASTPLSPQEILERGRQVYRKLGLVTVYRTVNLLAEMSLVRRIHREDDCHGYLPTSPGHRHALVCQHCGGAVEFLGAGDVYALIERVEVETGYRVDDHLLQLSGLCPGCQETRNEDHS